MKKNPFHNFTKKELKSIISEYNLKSRQRAMMPQLNLNDPKIRKAVARGRKIALKFAIQERRVLEKAKKDRINYGRMKKWV